MVSGDRHKRDRGGVRGFSFIPSLSISSTASLTRRMTVTTEARQKREKKKENSSMNRVRFHVMAVTEMRWRMCVSMCVRTC